ncbi:MAG: hypothetical protein IPO40_11800 [Fibrobacteres bacterium]|nr:hypothetical protein [Fibrobacterota bacterium]
MNRKLGWMIGAIALTCGASQAALLPYPEPKFKYPSYADKDTKLKSVWSGWLQRFVVAGVIQGNDPNGNKKPISEGQSYGMLLAVWMNDQKNFDIIWKATESKFWNASKGWYKWDPNTGGTSGDNFAGDADQDICAALIFASALVDGKYWTDNGYKAKAKTVLQSLDKNFYDGNGYVYSWPGENGILNPSYHMPAWHPIFKEFGAENGISIDWKKRSNAAFALINAQPNAASGMARNFSTSSGAGTGGTSTPTSADMGFDAIRVPYRMAMAAMWYPDSFPQAVSWCKSIWSKSVVDPDMPGMYTGLDSPKLWGWLGVGGTTKPEYEEFMPRAMWASAAIAVASKDAKAAAALSVIGQSFSGKHISSAGTEDYLTGANSVSPTDPTSPAMNYFGQSLGLMGALMLYGRAWNVWDDIKHTWIPIDTAASFTAAVTATPGTIQQTNVGSTPVAAQISSITATLSKSVSWTLRVKGRTTGAVYSTTGTGTAVKVEFTSLKKSLGTTVAFGEETADIRVTYSGLDTNTNTKCKATIVITKNTGVAPRATRGEGSVRWVDGALELQDPSWLAGDRVQVRTLDLGGRTLQSSDVVLASAKEGVRLNTKLDAFTGVRVLELSNGAISRRYVLSPNP